MCVGAISAQNSIKHRAHIGVGTLNSRPLPMKHLVICILSLAALIRHSIYTPLYGSPRMIIRIYTASIRGTVGCDVPRHNGKRGRAYLQMRGLMLFVMKGAMRLISGPSSSHSGTPSSSSSSSSQVIISCNLCGNILQKFVCLRNHIIILATVAIAAHIRTVSFSQWDSLTIIILIPIFSISCNQCGNIFQEIVYLRKHIMNLHNAADIRTVSLSQWDSLTIILLIPILILLK